MTPLPPTQPLPHLETQVLFLFDSAHTVAQGVEVEVAAVFAEVPGLQDPPQTRQNFKEVSAGTTPSTTPSPDLAGGSPQTRKNSRLTLNHVETVTLARVTLARASAGL